MSDTRQQRGPRAGSGLELAARASVTALLAVLAVGIADTASVLLHPLTQLVAGVDVAVGLMAAWALHLSLVPIAFVATVLGVFAHRRATGRARVLATMSPTIVLAVIAGLRFAELAANWPWSTRVLLVALPIVHGATVLALTRPRARRVAIVVACGIVLAALVLNGWTLRGVRPGVHQGLVLVAWGFALPAAFVASPRVATAVAREPRRGRLLVLLCWAALAVFVVQAGGGFRSAPAGARLVPWTMAPAAAAVLDGLGPALELDGDGDPSWPAGSDCAPLDGTISPSTPEIAGDGKDQNCLAGDPTVQDVEALARDLAGAETSSPTRAPATKILLVTIDALRHDVDLPRLSTRLGDRCVQHDRTWSTSNETTYAMYSLFTSRFPSQGVFSDVGAFHVPVDDPAARLPGVLGENGFATMAVAFHHRFDPRLGLTHGFSQVWTAEARPEVIFDVAGQETTARALAWLDGRASPWFLWVHYYDPHEPYILHDGIPLREHTPREAYLGEVAYTERRIVDLLDGIAGELEEIAIVVTADHGEAFGEHGQRFHATDLFDEQIRVPLWVCPPRGHPPPPTSPAASLVDVAPTILELAGLPRPASFTGRSLLRPAGAVPVFAETIRGRRMQAAMSGPRKVIRYLEGDVRLMFDLDADPGEQHDLVGVADDELHRMEVLLDTWTALVARPREP